MDSKAKKASKKKSQKEIENEKIERYKVWQRLLVRPEGVSYEEILESQNEEIEYDTLRHDKKDIVSLLKEQGLELKKKDGHPARFYVEVDNLDLVALDQKKKVAQPYMAILDMLSKSKGLLPEEFLNSLCDKYQKLSENVNVSKSISFDADYDCMATLDLFPVVYKSLNNSTLGVKFHPVNKPEESVEGQFSPEYLKQYRSNWYAFGMFEEKGKPAVFQKIPLSNIIRYDDEEADEYPFVKSHIENYEEYFEDIIGVENPEINEVETIKFRISNRMFQRMLNKPLHSTLKIYKELDTKGFKGMKMNVKYNMELMRAILNLGSDIEIVEPAHIRKRVIKSLQKALRLYDK